MSEVTIEQLQNQIKQHQDNAKGLVAQLEATKQMLNDQLAAVLQLKTNLVIFNQANQEHVINESKLKAEIDNLNAKIIELTPKA